MVLWVEAIFPYEGGENGMRFLTQEKKLHHDGNPPSHSTMIFSLIFTIMSNVCIISGFYSPFEFRRQAVSFKSIVKNKTRSFGRSYYNRIAYLHY